ncbi:flagellar hook-basal body complex protein [Dethiosulfovibrio salsuginis]|uniref:Flagellar hook protein FlgE n=1 Tax=Dethiosulfovibrio salsuginis TaxID=561720 RepID=A0A1X7JNC5_9BACT|nr:flagellar hook-basal body complex protein [Dethiosulfovibrio salsuginis]SMG29465.1 flagellar hook-basal body protein [Dethiosulfovibrio salsuginis]
MLKSLMTGVSGVKVHQKRMDVVGNNIANVNTTGFKGSSVIFQDLLSQNLKGAMAPDQNRGGVNAQQIGTGVGVGAIETIHTQGTVSQTGNRTDMAIQGDGYFIVRSGQEDLYTRAGNFVLDSNSDLVMSGTGYKVQGNEVTIDEDGNEIWGSTLDDINIPLGKKMEAKATSTVGYRCNLDSRVDPYLPFGIPEGLKFSALDAKKTPYTIEVSEGSDVDDFLVVRVTNETDKSVEIFKFEFDGVEQSSSDDSIYYPKLKDTDETAFNSETGKMRIRDLEFPLGAYMNYQAVTIDDSTGTSHTYLAEVTEGEKDAVVKLWGQGKNEITGALQKDYFQWTVPKTDEGLFDPDSTLSISTGNDSEFPDEISLFMNVGSSGKTLNFRGNVNPIIGPATSNSVVNKDGNTARLGLSTELTSVYDITVGNDTITVDTSFSKSNVAIGESFTMTFASEADANGTKTSKTATLTLRCIGFNEAGNGLFQWYDSAAATPSWKDFGGTDPTVSLRQFTAATTAADGDYTLSYNATTGAFSVTPPASSYLPSATPPTAIGYVENFQNQAYPTAFSNMATNGNYAVGLKTPETYTETGVGGGTDDFALSMSLPQSVSVGEEIELTLNTEVTGGTTSSGTATLHLKCISLNSAGNAVFQWSDDGGTTWKDFAVNGGTDPEVAGLDYYDAEVADPTTSTAPGGWTTSAATPGNPYTLGYDPSSGSFVLGMTDNGNDNRVDLAKLTPETSANLGTVGSDWTVTPTLPSVVKVGDEIKLDLVSEAAGNSPVTSSVDLKCTGFTSAGVPVFQWSDDGGTTWNDFASKTALPAGTDPNIPDIYFYDGAAWGTSTVLGAQAQLSYNPASGEFSFTVQDAAATTATVDLDPLVSTRATTKINLNTPQAGSTTISGNVWSVNAELPKTVSKGEEIELKLRNGLDNGDPDLDRTLRLICDGFDGAGDPIFRYHDGAAWQSFGVGGVGPDLANMYYHDGTNWETSDGTGNRARLSYASGVFTFDIGNGTAFTDSVALASITGSRIFHEPTDFQVPARADIGYGFKEGETTDDFMTMTLDYPDASGISAKTEEIKLSFRGVSTEGNVILQPSPSTVNIPVADPDDPDKLTLQSHRVTYDPATGSVSLVNEATGKSAWSYSNFKFQTTEINGVNYLVDYDSSGASDATYGDIVTLWGPNDLGVMTPFKINTTDPEGLTYTNTAGEIVYGGSQTFDGNFSGGVKVTAKPSPTDPSRLIFTYDSNNGGKAITTIRENSASVHEGKGTIYDSLGNAHTMEVAWKKVGNNTWSWEAFFPDSPELALKENKGILLFSEDGKILSGGENTISVGFSAIGAADAEIVLDFSGKSFDKDEIDGVTQYGSAFTTKPYAQDGYKMGVLKDFSTSNDGTIVGIYDNGQNQALYKVSLAKFANPQGLLKNGGTVFSKSINSGEPSVVNAMVEGAGSIAGASLESSNVDITDEFTNLITTQRGFQASSRVITTSDSMLEELLNLKR